MPAPSKTWKDVERRVCGWFGLRRNPGSGSSGGSGSCGDCLPPGEPGVLRPRNGLYIEIKHFAAARLPGLALYRDSKAKATAEKRRAINVYHEKGTQNYLAVLDAKLLAEIIAKAETNGFNL